MKDFHKSELDYAVPRKSSLIYLQVLLNTHIINCKYK